MYNDDELELKSLLWIVFSILFFCSFAFLNGCGTAIKVKGSTEHNAHVNGEVKATTELILKIDLTGCEPLEGGDKAQCIKDTVNAMGDLVELIKALTCKDNDQGCIGG